MHDRGPVELESGSAPLQRERIASCGTHDDLIIVTVTIYIYNPFDSIVSKDQSLVRRATELRVGGRRRRPSLDPGPTPFQPVRRPDLPDLSAPGPRHRQRARPGAALPPALRLFRPVPHSSPPPIPASMRSRAFADRFGMLGAKPAQADRAPDHGRDGQDPMGFGEHCTTGSTKSWPCGSRSISGRRQTRRCRSPGRMIFCGTGRHRGRASTPTPNCRAVRSPSRLPCIAP